MTKHEADSAIRTIGSLCSGVGGLDRALAGQLSWTAELNEAAARILKREHPEVPNLGDITAPDFAGTHVALLTSGDPCQSMSAAGRQKASEDERFLWPYVIDIIRRVRPAEIFLENVQNIVSVALIKGAADWRGQRGSVLKMRLDDLREAGYAVRWTVLGACAVGAPHHRHRWFLRARYVGAGAPVAERVIVKCGAPRGGGRFLLPTTTTRDVKGRNQRDDESCLHGAVMALLPTPTALSYGNNQGGAAGRVGPVRHSLESLARMDLLPTPTTRDGMGGPGTSPKREGGMNLRTQAVLLPTPRATDGVNGGPGQRGSKGDLAMGSAVQAEHWGRFADAIALWEDIIGRPAPDPTVPAPRGGRRLNPALSEWMMGYPEGYLTGELERNDALRCAGNGVVPLQAATAWDLLSW